MFRIYLFKNENGNKIGLIKVSIPSPIKAIELVLTSIISPFLRIGLSH